MPTLEGDCGGDDGSCARCVAGIGGVAGRALKHALSSALAAIEIRIPLTRKPQPLLPTKAHYRIETGT